MKSERRHELQRNALGSELSKIWEFLRRRGSALAWGALGVAAVVLGIVWYVGKGHTEAEQVQSQYARAILASTDQRTTMLESIAGKTSQPRWAALANVVLGDDAAERMLEQWYRVMEADRSALRSQAETYYQKVLSAFPKEEVAVARAHLGLGKLAEDWDEEDGARAQYQEVLQAAQASQALRGDPVVYMAQQAMQRLGQLQGKVYMPATAPAPTTEPATGPATAPSSGPAASSGPATGPATRAVEPSSGPTSRAVSRPDASPSPAPVSTPASAAASGSTTSKSD